jgi:hypothetical protein
VLVAIGPPSAVAALRSDAVGAATLVGTREVTGAGATAADEREHGCHREQAQPARTSLLN